MEQMGRMSHSFETRARPLGPNWEQLRYLGDPSGANLNRPQRAQRDNRGLPPFIITVRTDLDVQRRPPGSESDTEQGYVRPRRVPRGLRGSRPERPRHIDE